MYALNLNTRLFTLIFLYSLTFGFVSTSHCQNHDELKQENDMIKIEELFKEAEYELTYSNNEIFNDLDSNKYISSLKEFIDSKDLITSKKASDYYDSLEVIQKLHKTGFLKLSKNENWDLISNKDKVNLENSMYLSDRGNLKLFMDSGFILTDFSIYFCEPNKLDEIPEIYIVNLEKNIKKCIIHFDNDNSSIPYVFRDKRAQIPIYELVKIIEANSPVIEFIGVESNVNIRVSSTHIEMLKNTLKLFYLKYFSSF